MTNLKEIPIFYSINDKYVPYLSVSIESIIENASDDNIYRIKILYQKLSKGSIKELSKLNRNNVKIEFISMDEDFTEKMGSEHTKLRGDYFTYTIYFRLFIAEMFDELDKAIYLDADTVVNCDIADFYHIDLQGNLLAAAPDTFATDNPETVKYVQDALGIPINKYFNSGVLLMDLAQFREIKFASRFLKFLNTYQLDVLAADQDYLNLMAFGHVLPLERIWNATPTIQKVDDSNPQIIHYCLFYKPWHYSDIQNEKYFWNYASNSNYYVLLRQERDLYSEEDKQNDNKNVHYLLEKALSVVEAGETRKKIESSRALEL
ncbi:glycosyltransferase family 8 protein [Companilactobacillus jidongensis]|uniref:glycosyltransferase family 8 protein n=1 Tax=Companilactobacillus jidongensis TaxID=2486006 RepID=UPI000F766D98|nr:glycosyltransferase family 8 protein [Companilactobacillus jidongensis]